MSEATRQAAAVQASRRMVSRGERPGHRPQAAPDGSWKVDAMPWLGVSAFGREAALDAARSAIAQGLEVDPNSFDLS